MIKGKRGLAKFIRWFKCVILDRHEDIRLPFPMGNLVGMPSIRVEIFKCRFCGRTMCDYL